MQFKASAQLRAKLQRLQDLMCGATRDGDLGDVIEQAVTEKLERLETRRFGSGGKRRGSGHGSQRSSTSSRYIPAAVRRAVWTRDRGQCRFVDSDGRRCGERRRLEFHHRHPVGYGGGHSVENVALVCHAHSLHLASIDYGWPATPPPAATGSAATGSAAAGGRRPPGSPLRP